MEARSKQDRNVGVEINIREGFSRTRTLGLAPLLRRIGSKTLRHRGVRGRTLSVLVTNDEEMRALNHRWRKLDRTTDVLSFEGDDDLLGDVVISLDKAERQAARLGVDREEEIARLLIHGCLHLLGHEHRTTAERRAMNALTEEILRDVL
jgi:probable rRNA maturation factor